MKFNSKRILVTGANGFIGRHLCKTLYSSGAYVFGMVRQIHKNECYLSEQYTANIYDQQAINRVIEEVKPEIVIHLAGEKQRARDIAGYRTNYETNLIGSLNLIEACQKEVNLRAFLYIGSCEEYGLHQPPFDEDMREEPVSTYGVTKLAVTQLLQTLTRVSSFPAIILRPSIVYGPGQSTDMFIPDLIKTLLSGAEFEMTLGEQTRDFVYIDDVLDAIMKACYLESLGGQVVNISSNSPVYINELAKNIANMISPATIKLLKIGAKPYRPSETMNYWANNTLALELLGWKPRVMIDAGLKTTLSCYRDIEKFG
jgi:UDP-glucose 4-epimerase